MRCSKVCDLRSALLGALVLVAVVLVPTAAAAAPSTGPHAMLHGLLTLGAVALVVVVGALLVYLLPAIVASARGATNFGWVLALNVLLGWSVAGWAAALILAVVGPRRPTS